MKGMCEKLAINMTDVINAQVLDSEWKWLKDKYTMKNPSNGEWLCVEIIVSS